MDFRITSLAPEPFAPLFGLQAAELMRRGARHVIADRRPGFPDRIELRDAAPGEALLLARHTHLPLDTPYRSAYAIYVLEGSRERCDRVNEVPEAFRSGVMALRAFGRGNMLCAADIAQGTDLEGLIERLFASAHTHYVHAHYAKPGCFAARIERA